ncbi:MAG TPA: dihydroneopterin aldolase [Fimbriimonadaceae bacterium]|nr:dihydroneopterin aldolase [Fimbriimonadaceae bacterium]
MSTIFVRGIEFYGYHGVSEAERSVGHRFSADVALEVNETASVTDDVADTVDYTLVAAAVVEIGRGSSVSTVERLARLIAERLLTDNPCASDVAVEVTKLLPPMPLPVTGAGVRLTLTQSR